MKIDNLENYAPLNLEDFENVEVPRSTAYGAAYLMSNYKGLYAAAINIGTNRAEVHLVCDRWEVANGYLMSLPAKKSHEPQGPEGLKGED